MKIDLTRFAGRFRQETRDNLTLLDNAIGRLDTAIREHRDTDGELREMMRVAHAMKGAARMLGFSGINRLCHSLEELLISLRSLGQVAGWQVDLIMEARKGVDRLLTLNPEGTIDAGEEPTWLIQLMETLKQGALGLPASIESIAQRDISEEIEAPVPLTSQRQFDFTRQSTVRVNVDTIDDLLYYGRELTQALEGLRKSHGDIDTLRSELEATVEEAKRETATGSLITNEAERIAKRLLLLSINLRERIADVDRSVRQIDSGAVELRMRPISELFETIPLQVRELSKALNREVDVDFSGESVRLDGRIVELLREPLVHIIRNALDHGLETPDERTAVGKSPAGRLTVGAFENAGWARVVIADDGRGIDLEAVWTRAVELGLASSESVPEDDPKKGYRFLFDDRFTSRRGATDISGRGVGLAAVKRRLQELRGDVTVESVLGMGAKFTLSMPSSLSSQRILVTSIFLPQGRIFVAFPTAMVRETTHRDSTLENRTGEDGFGIGSFAKTLSLSALLSGRQETPHETEIYLVLCTDGLKVGAFAVDQIVAETEVVIEPLPHIARSSEIIAGAAPLTSDEIIFVLNVPTLLNLAIMKSVIEKANA